MSNIVTWSVYDHARRLAEQGETKAAWQVLAQGGDQYARFAHYVLSGEWSFLTCMRAAHWHSIIPQEPVGGKVWNDIAQNALITYLGFIDSNHREWCRDMGVDPAAHRQMPLPNTLQIEQGYIVFEGLRAKRPLSNTALLMLLRRMKRGDLTVHGFRSTFRVWAAEMTPYPREVCEMALAHTVQSETEASYQRSDLFDKRKELMDEWAEYCLTDSKK